MVWHGYSLLATTEHDMTRIHGIATFAGRTFGSTRDAVQAFVDAGCPNQDRNAKGYSVGAFVTSDGESATLTLFQKLPDRFAGKTRAEVRAMYDAGIRPWSYVEFWTAWLSGQ
jgi:chloramphenicol 3-O-phosphotransferase